MAPWISPSGCCPRCHISVYCSSRNTECYKGRSLWVSWGGILSLPSPAQTWEEKERKLLSGSTELLWKGTFCLLSTCSSCKCQGIQAHTTQLPDQEGLCGWRAFHTSFGRKPNTSLLPSDLLRLVHHCGLKQPYRSGQVRMKNFFNQE